MPNQLTMHDVRCPLCDCDDEITVFTSPDWTGTAVGDFRLVRCRACQHRYLNPMPVDESLADCYPQNYGPHQRVVGHADSPDKGEQENSSQNQPSPWYLASWVRSIPGPRAYYRWVTDTKSVWVPPEDGAGRRALELGCSSGWFLAQLRNRGWSPVGVDLVEGPLAKARDAGFEVHHGTLDRVQFEAEVFDAVFAWMVIEHVPRPRETLRAIHHVLKPGGHFAFSIPNVASWESRLFGRHWRGYDLPRHPQHFTPRVIRTLLDDEGFEVVAISHQPSFLYWIGSAGSWLRKTFPNWSIGETLMEQYENQPPLWSYLLLGPLGRLNALLHQSGRLTIIASRKS